MHATSCKVAMNFRRNSFFLLHIFFILHLYTLTSAQPNPLYYECSKNGNFTANSAYQRNLNDILTSMSSDTEIDYGFFNISSGEEPDVVNAIGLCRGDIRPQNCTSCLNDSRSKLSELCPTEKEAIMWYDECMLRYSNRSIFRTKELNPGFYLRNPENATDPEGFLETLRTLMTSLRTEAAAGDSRIKFAVGNTTDRNIQPVYAMLQCTPDLSQLQCDDCLAGVIGELRSCCFGKIGGRLIRPSCNFRFENYRFYDPTAIQLPPLTPPPTPTTEGDGNNTATIIIAIVVPIVVVVALVIGIWIILRVRKQRKQYERNDFDEDGSVDNITTVESLQCDLGTIRAATNNFSDENKLGQGGFGSVYKGVLPNGQVVAVKRLSGNSGQGDIEFKNEALLVAKLQHRCLVRLLGFCLQGKERILVYEFVPNTSLDNFIFDPTKRALLNWDARYKIIGGIARGLLYLHEDSRLRIIHRDLKASNILLDEDMNPKIADFGMARLFSLDETQGNTSRIVGTYGYMAPEYAMHGHFSVKSDVYSFGVLILEIVSGHRNNNFRRGEEVEDLISQAWKSWREGTTSNLIDPSLTTGSRTEMMRCIHIGLLCVQENVAARPTMASVALMLNSSSLTLPVPSQPASFLLNSISESDISSQSNINSAGTNLDYSKSKYSKMSNNEVSITEIYPR